VAESNVAPHFLNGRNGVWVCADEFSAKVEARLASENELRELFDRRKLIDERRDFVRCLKELIEGMKLEELKTTMTGVVTDSPHKRGQPIFWQVKHI